MDMNRYTSILINKCPCESIQINTHPYTSVYVYIFYESLPISMPILLQVTNVILPSRGSEHEDCGNQAMCTSLGGMSWGLEQFSGPREQFPGPREDTCFCGLSFAGPDPHGNCFVKMRIAATKGHHTNNNTTKCTY